MNTKMENNAEKYNLLEKLSKDLSLKFETQDWGVINSDKNRVKEFILIKMNNQYLGKWVSCLLLYYKDEFQEINNLQMVHQDDQKFVKENFTGTIYYCCKVEGNYLLLQSKKYKIRVKKTAIKEIFPNSKFNWGDKVEILEKQDSEAMIDDLFWHQKDQEFKYYLTINGKKKSKRYSAKDLKLIN